MGSANILEKQKVVDKIKDNIDNSSLVVFTDYRGVDATGMTGLRKTLKSENATVAVLKNTLIRRALGELKYDYPKEVLIGPSAMVSTTDDAAKTAKILVKFSKEEEAFEIKGGILENVIIDVQTVSELAMLPSKDELIAKVVGTIKAPLNNLVMVLSGPARGIVLALNAIKEQKEKNQEVKND